MKTQNTQQVSAKQARQPVTAQTLSAWRNKLKHGDKTAIAGITGVSRAEVIIAFEGLARQSLIECINRYYGIEPLKTAQP